MAALVSGIRLLVPVVNQNPQVQPPLPPRPTYTCVTYGGNTTPHQLHVAPGITQITLGNVTVPNAVLGATGTYPIAAVRWDIIKVMEKVRSQVEVSGTVTYVTVETPTEITTTQTINMTCRWRIAVVPLDPPTMGMNGQTPIATLNMWIRAGNANMVADEEDHGAICNEEDVVEV